MLIRVLRMLWIFFVIWGDRISSLGLDGRTESRNQEHKDIDSLLRQGRASDAMLVIESLSPELRQQFVTKILVARALLQLGQKQQGEKMLKTVIQEDPLNTEARVVLGKFYVFQQQWQSARQLLNEALKLDPNNVTAMVFMAKVFSQDGEAKRAQDLVLKAAALAPDDENIQFELGMNHLAHGNFVDAKQAFDAAARLNPKLDKGMLARIYMHYKQIEWAVVELEQVAAKIVSKTITNSGENRGVEAVTEAEMTSLLLLAESYDMVGLPAEALDMYHYLLTLEPNNVLANTGAGLLLLGTGTRNFASLQACGLNQETAIRHLSLALQSQVAKGQTANAIRNAQDLAENALNWCKNERLSVENWSQICSEKRNLLLSKLPRMQSSTFGRSSSTTTFSPSTDMGKQTSASIFTHLGRLRRNLYGKIIEIVGGLISGSGLCNSRLSRIRLIFGIDSSLWETLCASKTKQTQGRFSQLNNDIDNDNNNDEGLLMLTDDDTEDITAMKRKWASRQNIPSVPRISVEKATKPRNGETVSATEFFQEFVLKARPVVISNLQSEWGLPVGDGEFSKDIFTVAGLVKTFGNNTVTVSVSEHGRFDGPENGALWGLDSETDVLVRPPTTSMKFVDFMALIEGRGKRGGQNANAMSDGASVNTTFYLEYLALHQYLGPEFSRLVSLPESLQTLTKRKLRNSSSELRLTPLVHNLWIGGSPTISPLHYDDYENLLAQIRGRKELILFSPTDHPNLYYKGRPKGKLKFEFPSSFNRDLESVDKRGFVFGSRWVFDLS